MAIYSKRLSESTLYVKMGLFVDKSIKLIAYAPLCISVNILSCVCQCFSSIYFFAGISDARMPNDRKNTGMHTYKNGTARCFGENAQNNNLKLKCILRGTNHCEHLLFDHRFLSLVSAGEIASKEIFYFL